MKPIQLPAILYRVATKADGSLSLSFSTQEMRAEETTVLIKLCRMELTMKLTPVGETLEAPVEVKGELSNKSQSQRIRSVLFCHFKHLEELDQLDGKTFEQFYHDATESFIESVKSKLPEQP